MPSNEIPAAFKKAARFGSLVVIARVLFHRNARGFPE
jgi:hypothetical protein